MIHSLFVEVRLVFEMKTLKFDFSEIGGTTLESLRYELNEY